MILPLASKEEDEDQDSNIQGFDVSRFLNKRRGLQPFLLSGISNKREKQERERVDEND